MSRDTGVRIFWPTGTPWFVVVLAGLFFVARGPTPTSSSEPVVQGEATVQHEGIPAEAPAASGPEAWADDVWGTLDLLRRFLGSPPEREKRAPEDIRGLLTLDATARADAVRAQVDALKDYERQRVESDRAAFIGRMAAIKREVRALADLRVVVATISDYHDSNRRWTADEAFDALQAAAGAASYSLFDFYLPDWQPVVTEARAQRLRSHEREPAALLFKRWAPASRPELLLVLLVPETPTSGLRCTAASLILRTKARTPFQVTMDAADRTDALKLEVTAPTMAPRPSSATSDGVAMPSSSGSAWAGIAAS